MKLNVSYPVSGAQKTFEVNDDHKLRLFYDKRMGAEVEADSLGDEWKGYVLRVAGGNDKQGFPMKQGVLTNTRVRLLLKKGHSCYRPRRTGERKRKSVRGCIVDQNLSALALIITRKGEADIDGLTNVTVPRRLGPKRASNIRKLFNLTKEDDVRQYVVKRPLPEKDGKKARVKAPKIQRLITPIVLQRKRHRIAIKKHRVEARKEAEAEYAKLIIQRRKEEKQRRRSRLSSLRDSKSSTGSQDKRAAKKEAKAAAKAVEAATEAKKKKEEPAKVTKKDAKTVEKKPAEKKASEKKGAEKKGAEKKVAEKKGAEKKVAEKKPAEKKVAEKKSAEKKVAEKKPETAPKGKGGDAKKATAPATKEAAKRKPEQPAKKAGGDAKDKKPKKK